MSEISCQHCGYKFEEQQCYCPSCRTPTPDQQRLNFAKLKRKIIYAFIGLVIFCAFMIVWLPRVINQ